MKPPKQADLIMIRTVSSCKRTVSEYKEGLRTA